MHVNIFQFEIVNCFIFLDLNETPIQIILFLFNLSCHFVAAVRETSSFLVPLICVVVMQ